MKVYSNKILLTQFQKNLIPTKFLLQKFQEI